MPRAYEKVDNALRRSEIIFKIIEKAREQALANPTNPRNVELGILEIGTDRNNSVRIINETFSDITNLLNYVSIIDMTSAFEAIFKERIATAIGEARRSVEKEYKINLMKNIKSDLVKNIEEFQGLNNILKLVKGQISPELEENFNIIRSNRNKFAHGADISIAPTVIRQDVRNILIEIINRMQ